MAKTIERFSARSLSFKLGLLGPGKAIYFGLLVSEGLIQNYAAFQKETGSGDSGVLIDALDWVWTNVNASSLDREAMTTWSANCEALAPSSSDFDSLYVTAAQDACFSVCALFDFQLDGRMESIVEIATYATDTIDLFVQESETLDPADPLLETKILNHPLMQQELSAQEFYLKMLDLRQSTSISRIRDQGKLVRAGPGNLVLHNGY